MSFNKQIKFVVFTFIAIVLFGQGCGQYKSSDGFSTGDSNLENTTTNNGYLTAADFVGTGANFSLASDNSLFDFDNSTGVLMISTTSNLDNIHSHYSNGTDFGDYTYSGSMMASDSGSGVGVTFLSGYPNEDSYYRLSVDGNNQNFHLSARNSTACQGTDSGVIAQTGEWYSFKIMVKADSTKTSILAKVWPSYTREPFDAQMSCVDTGNLRRVMGTVGLWASGSGEKKWSDLFIGFDPYTPPATTPIVPPSPMPQDCGSLAHGQSESRTRYQAQSVAFGSSCVSEVQMRTCNDGQLSSYTPNNYQFDTCTVDPAPTPIPTPIPPLSNQSGNVGMKSSPVSFQSFSVQSTCTVPKDQTLGPTYYLDPVNGKPGNNGSASSPYPSLEQAISNNIIQGALPGTTFILKGGNHGGRLQLKKIASNFIYFKAAAGETPFVSSLTIQNSSHLAFDGLKVLSNVAYGKTQSLVRIGGSDNIVFINGDVRTKEDHANLTQTEWQEAPYGIHGFNAPCMTLVNNYIGNIGFGIHIRGANNLILNNTVHRFSKDGIRMYFGSDSLVKNNLVQESYKVDGNHDDGFQYYPGTSGTNITKNFVFDGNMIIRTKDKNNPYAGHLQGMFSGAYVKESWQVTNNVIIIEKYHGLNLGAVQNSIIAFNTVVGDYNTWIGIKGTNNRIENNLAEKFINDAVGGAGNINLPADPSSYFRAFDLVNHVYDLRPSASSPVIGAAQGSTRLNHDIVGNPRSNPATVGAYEK